MSIAERMLNYRARNGLSQSKLADLMDEKPNTIFRCESGVKMHKVNQVRLETKMNKLEEKENEKL